MMTDALYDLGRAIMGTVLATVRIDAAVTLFGGALMLVLGGALVLWLRRYAATHSVEDEDLFGLVVGGGGLAALFLIVTDVMFVADPWHWIALFHPEQALARPWLRL